MNESRYTRRRSRCNGRLRRSGGIARGGSGELGSPPDVSRSARKVKRAADGLRASSSPVALTVTLLSCHTCRHFATSPWRGTRTVPRIPDHDVRITRRAHPRRIARPPPPAPACSGGYRVSIVLHEAARLRDNLKVHGWRIWFCDSATFLSMCARAAGSERIRMTTITAWACVIAVLCSSIIEGAWSWLHNDAAVRSRYGEHRNFEGVIAAVKTGAGTGRVWYTTDAASTTNPIPDAARYNERSHCAGSISVVR